MAILHIFSLYDSKAGAFLRPFFAQNTQVAERALSDAVNNPQETVARHPEDFCLFKLGTFDEESGELVPEAAPEAVRQAITLRPEMQRELRALTGGES